MGEEEQNFFKAWLVVFASLCYSYLIPPMLPHKFFRVLSLLPIFYIFTMLPFTLTRPLPTLIMSWFISFVANLKLLLYGFNLGPLTTQNSLIMFILFAAFPLKLREKSLDPTRPRKILKLNFWEKFIICFILAFIYYLNTNFKVLFNFILYLSLDLCFAIPSIFVVPLGLRLEPPSYEPYGASSLQEFWGKRWNRMVSFALRDTIYSPVRSFIINYVGPKWAHVLGTLASFIVSGLMHELMFYHVIRDKPTWEVTCFFVLQGVCVVLEMLVKWELGWAWNKRWSGPLIFGLVIMMGHWLFFPPLFRNRIDIMALEDAKAYGKSLLLWKLT